jgi:hypothetical protein
MDSDEACVSNPSVKRVHMAEISAVEKSVCQILIYKNGQEYIASGFLFKFNNKDNKKMLGLMTTNAVISQKVYDSNEIKCTLSFKVGGLKLPLNFRDCTDFITSPTMDATYFSLPDALIKSLKASGAVWLTGVGDVKIGDTIYIIQYAVRRDEYNRDKYTGKAAFAAGIVHELSGYRIYHNIDTEKGSSGSPVVVNGTLVVGLHRAKLDKERREAINFKHIFTQLLEGTASCDDEADNSGGIGCDEDLQDFQTDGGSQCAPLTVNVVQLLLPTDALLIEELQKKTAYPIEYNKANGRAYIINVNKVVGNHEERFGTDRDRDYLKALFEGLAFDVTVYNDTDGLSAKEIEDAVHQMAKTENDKRDAQCFVLCILSHGVTLRHDNEGLNDEGCIFGTDGEPVKNDDIFEILENCDGLKGKPRLIFFQACRRISQVHADDITSDHFLVGYPAHTGQYAFRYPEKKNSPSPGSVYIYHLVQEFMENARECDVVEMLKKVANEVKAIPYKYRGKSETMEPETVSKLEKKFYFFPRNIRD